MNKRPTYSSNSPLRGFCAACAATILALCCTVQCSIVNKCPTYSSNSPLQGFSAACAATILALCCAVQCSFASLHASMQTCKLHCTSLFTKKKSLTEYYFCQGRIILTIRGATLNSRYSSCAWQDTNISRANDVCPHVAEYSG